MVVIDRKYDSVVTPLQRWAVNVFGHAAPTCPHGRQFDCRDCDFMWIQEAPYAQWVGPLPVAAVSR